MDILEELELFKFSKGVSLMPKMHYLHDKGVNFAVGWTVQKANEDKFWVLEYKIQKDKSWRLKRATPFSKRKTAKTHALKRYKYLLDKKLLT